MIDSLQGSLSSGFKSKILQESQGKGCLIAHLCNAQEIWTCTSGDTKSYYYAVKKKNNFLGNTLPWSPKTFLAIISLWRKVWLNHQSSLYLVPSTLVRVPALSSILAQTFVILSLLYLEARTVVNDKSQKSKWLFSYVHSAYTYARKEPPSISLVAPRHTNLWYSS